MNSVKDGIFIFSEIKKKFNFWNFFYKKKENFFIKKVVIDSREIKKGDLFIAIKGENNDGHNYIEQAIINGAKCIICEKQKLNIKLINKYSDICFIFVEDTIIALHDLAKYKREILKNTKIIGITGNVGKTTTREMLKVAIGQFLNTYAARNNYNNYIGLPLTIINTPMDAECLILELGMNHIGEIDILTKIALPDIAIITNICPAHICNFNNINEIVMAKAEIFNGMNENCVVILDKSGDFFNIFVNLAKSKGIHNIITVSMNDKKANIYLKKYTFLNNFTIKYVISANGNDISCKINGIIKHNILNSLFLFATACVFGFDLKKISNKLSNFQIVPGRGNFEIKKINNKVVTFINDCYNSSPEALKSSIITLSKIGEILPNSRIIAVIGDMLELGEFSKKYHADIAEVILKSNIKNIICIGDESRTIFDKLPNDFNKYHFSKTEDFIDEIMKFIKDKDVILLKASRGMHFDKILDKINSYID